MTLSAIAQFLVGTAIGLAVLWLIRIAIPVVDYYRTIERLLLTFYQPTLTKTQDDLEFTLQVIGEVRAIVRDMQNIASHSAFISNDPYVYTRLLVAALSLPEVDE